MPEQRQKTGSTTSRPTTTPNSCRCCTLPWKQGSKPWLWVPWPGLPLAWADSCPTGPARKREQRIRESLTDTCARSGRDIRIRHQRCDGCNQTANGYFRGYGPGLCCGKCRRSEEHTSELQSLMRISYAVFCLKTKKHDTY